MTRQSDLCVHAFLSFLGLGVVSFDVPRRQTEPREVEANEREPARERRRKRTSTRSDDDDDGGDDDAREAEKREGFVRPSARSSARV